MTTHEHESQAPGEDIPVHSDEWDAGEMGCGEVLIKLRLRMQRMERGQVLRLISRDIAAPIEMPAWCRMTGRRLLRADHPQYWIEQK